MNRRRLYLWLGYTPLVLSVLLLVVMFVSSVGAMVFEPSAQERAGHCYLVTDHSPWLFMAGYQRSEVPCP